MTPPSQAASGGNTRLLGLDLLRLLAVLMVLGRHMEKPPESWQSPVASAFRAWQEYGGLGVDLFLVLSGFLVSGLLFSEYQKHGRISVSRFYVRRAWRIYPAFYTLIIVSYFSYHLGFGWEMRERQLYTEILFIQNYQMAFWNHTWTLALEEHFYFLLPLGLLLLIRLNRGAADPFRAMPRLVLASSCLFLAARLINYAVRSEYSWYTHAWPSHLRMDSLFFGVAVAYAYRFHREAFERRFKPWRHALIAAGAAVLSVYIWAPVERNHWYDNTIGFTQYYLAGAALLVGVLMCRIPHTKLTGLLAAVGAQSYSIYLWHMALMYWAIPRLRDTLSWETLNLVYFAGAFVVGIGMAKTLELPLLRLRDRWYPSRIGLEAPQRPSLAPPHAARSERRAA
jgi:peptidoglycan/LPS O-acetylase OafA/YrhL